MCRSPEGVCSSLRQNGVKEAADLVALAHSGRGEGAVQMRGEPVVAEASVMFHQLEVCRSFFPGSCPCITGHWQWLAAQASRRGGVDNDGCLHTSFLVVAAAALVSHDCLWGLCREPWLASASGASLSDTLNPPSLCTRKQRGKKKSLASLAAPDFFPYCLPATGGTLGPLRMRSHSTPQSSPWDPTEARASAPNPHPSQQGSRQTSWAGECWSAPILCAGISPFCPLHPCCCTLLCGSEVSPLRRRPAVSTHEGVS